MHVERRRGVWMPFVMITMGMILGWQPVAAEWTYESSEPPIESQFEMIEGKDGAPMIKIPEGEFLMGANDGSRNERPEHTVWLDSYYIDQFEVVMERYQKFLDETNHELPPLWDDFAAVESAKDRPAVGMAWDSAKTYCEWAGKRLPTEAEWEKAARGTDERRYPWGHMQPFVDIARYNFGTTGWVSYAVTLAPVTSGVTGMSNSSWIEARDKESLWVIPHGGECFGMGGGLVRSNVLRREPGEKSTWSRRRRTKSLSRWVVGRSPEMAESDGPTKC